MESEYAGGFHLLGLVSVSTSFLRKLLICMFAIQASGEFSSMGEWPQPPGGLQQLPTMSQTAGFKYQEKHQGQAKE